MTALLVFKTSTPTEIAQEMGVRDCTVYLCEAHYEGATLMPDVHTEMSSGDLLTIVVRTNYASHHAFRIPQIPFDAEWDARRWRSQDQPFPHSGRVLIFRLVDRDAVADSRVRIPVDDWHTWSVVYAAVGRHWPDHSYDFVRRVVVHKQWNKCPELSNNVEVAIMDEHDSTAITRTTLIVCRDRITQENTFWAQRTSSPLSETDAVKLCRYTDHCQRQHVLCTVKWNGRPMRFVDSVYIQDGDILEIEKEARSPFCEMQIRHWNTADDFGNHLELLQRRSRVMRISRKTHCLGKWPKSSVHACGVGEIGEFYPISRTKTPEGSWNTGDIGECYPKSGFQTFLNNRGRSLERDSFVMRHRSQVNLHPTLRVKRSYDERRDSCSIEGFQGATNRTFWRIEPTRGLPPPGNPQDPNSQGGGKAMKYPCVTPFGRRIISIEELVPRLPEQEPDGLQRIPSPRETTTLSSLPSLDDCLVFQPGTDALHHDLNQLDKLDSAIGQKLQEQYWCLLEDWNNGQVDRIRVFTDGSFDQTTSSWAFAIVFDDGPEECILGYQAGQTEVAEGELGFFGGVTHSAQQGEIGALIWSSWWLLRWLLLTGWKGPIEFCWDSTSAGGKASGSFHSYDQSGAISRQIHQALETLMSPFEVKHVHVRAHTGVAYNELVDAAAKWAIKGSKIRGDSGQLQATLHALRANWTGYGSISFLLRPHADSQPRAKLQLILAGLTNRTCKPLSKT